jgi:predicted ATPase
MALAPLVDLIRSASASEEEAGELTRTHVAKLMHREGIKNDAVIRVIAFAVGTISSFEHAAAEGSPGRVRERMIWAMRRCIDEWCEAGPTIFTVEDLHWIDPTSKDLVRELVEYITGKPVLLMLTTRNRVPWAETGSHVGRIRLHPLQRMEAGVLLAEIWRGRPDSLPAAVVSLAYERTQGIPLFLEEISQWLASALGAGASEWVELLSNSRIASFENLLSARLGGMGHGKIVAQAASVIGREFDTELLRAILSALSEKRLSAGLKELVRAKILVPRRHGSQSGYAFRHSLIQESLYGLLLRKSRTALHQQIYRAVAGSPEARARMGAAVLAEHAERGGLFEEAAAQFIEAARESSARSAMAEARHLLDRVLKVLPGVPDGDERARLELSALAVLGPVLISTLGSRSPEARNLYERAVRIARRRPVHERAGWFPIYWGWWYTGGDFAVQRKRAKAVMGDLRDVADPEVQLQVQHCVWAIDFNLGRHETCIAAVDAGLALYHTGRGRESLIVYGGHDPRVCGLGQKGLSLWFEGFAIEARACIDEATRWAKELKHVGSIAHAYDIAAMLHRYRNDYVALKDTVASMRQLARKHEMRSLAAKALIFDGWRIARLGDARRGRKRAEEGFAIQREIGTREDFPVYSEMLADILERLGEHASAREVLDEALKETERTRHLYWQAELFRRRALLSAELGAGTDEVLALLDRALYVAREQNATMLLLMAYDSALELGLSERLDQDFHAVVCSAMTHLQQQGETAQLVASISSKMSGATKA